MRLLSRRKIGVFAIVTALAVLGTTTPANAHYVYQKGNVLQSNDNCVGSRAEVSHGVNNAGYYKGDTTSWNALGWAQCALTNYRPGGYIAVYQNILRWNGTQWTTCTTQGWMYNTRSVYKIETWHNAGRLLCPAGYYGTMVSSYVDFGSGWQGGAIWSGYHYLPA